jgi:hypothetical protein
MSCRRPDRDEVDVNFVRRRLVIGPCPLPKDPVPARHDSTTAETEAKVQIPSGKFYCDHQGAYTGPSPVQRNTTRERK